MLTPLIGEPKVKEFIAYDLEWYPETLELRLAGSWDGEHYRDYLSMAEFLDGELTDRTHGKVFFAHAGGNFDIQFVLEEVVKDPRYHVVATFSGSSAVIVKIKKGRHTWVFGDSYFLLREPLRKVGKWIGLEKLDCPFDAPMSMLREYNQRDCEILYRAIEHLQDEILTMGGEMKGTLASSAMALFRRRYLRHDVRTGAELNDEMMPAYAASRVEALQRDCLEGKYYDINSSFPYSMTYPQPGDLFNYSRKLPDKLDALYIADCTVTVRECYLPPLPYRDRNYRVLFPTGTWRSKFDVADIRLLLETGHRIETVHSVAHFHPFNDLSDYVQDLYEKKRTAEGFAREVYKLFLNALYGKFGERPEKEKILINPESTYCDVHHIDEGCECLVMIIPGIYQKNEIADIPHAHVPVSAHITALSRQWLYQYLSATKDPYYCDTDSVICGPRDSFPTSDRLGALKLEYEIKRGVFLAPKLYNTFRKPESDEDRASLVKEGWQAHDSGLVSKSKTKGFRKMTYEQFLNVSDGNQHEFERMLSIKETMRRNKKLGRNAFKPAQLMLSKKSTLRRPKRFLFANGQTRPWTIREIEDRGDATRTRPA